MDRTLSFTPKPNTTLLDFYNEFYLGRSYRNTIEAYVKGSKIALNYVFSENDNLVLKYRDKLDFKPFKGHLDILYEDESLLIINKPRGILVHPDQETNQETLCNVVAYYYLNKGYDISIRYAHRLDYDTTGIIIFTKDPLSQALIAHQIETHEIARIYLCIASGKFKELKGTINEPIGEDRHQANKKRVSKTGKVAITHYEVKEELPKNLNLVKVQLETGRTHQIRLHMSYIGHPLVGDSLYNGNTNLLDRQALHSYEVEFTHPITKEKLHFICPIPKDMKDIINKHKKTVRN